MGTIKTLILNWLGISPAQPTSVQINEILDHKGTVLKNRIWYRGDPSELDQFFKGIAQDAVTEARFWSAVPSADNRIRKMHTGLPGEIVDKLSGIVAGDLDGIAVDPQDDIEPIAREALEKPKEKQEGPNQERWNEIANDNKFSELLEESIKDALIEGDGAFKLTIDTEITEYPIIEFVSGTKVEYDYRRGRLFEVQFPEHHIVNKKTYKRVEVYGYGYIKYLLFDLNDKPVAFEEVPELKIEDVFFDNSVLMAIPMKFFKSNKFLNRGQSIYDRKTDSFDALDEVLSQWLDAIRAGRVKTYIPEDLLPKDLTTGEVKRGNPFDNQFIASGSSMKENANEEIKQVQPELFYQAYQQSYASFLDQCLQGILSPSTLGIDLKKTDNAEAQREKEKTTLYTRGKIVDVLNEIIPALVILALQVEDIMKSYKPGEYDVSVSFGEYASPDFTTVVETVGKAKLLGVMSLEKAIDEMYGDTMTDEEKALEVQRIRGDTGMTMDQEDAKEDIDPEKEGEDVLDDEEEV